MRMCRKGRWWIKNGFVGCGNYIVCAYQNPLSSSLLSRSSLFLIQCSIRFVLLHSLLRRSSLSLGASRLSSFQKKCLRRLLRCSVGRNATDLVRNSTASEYISWQQTPSRVYTRRPWPTINFQEESFYQQLPDHFSGSCVVFINCSYVFTACFPTGQASW